MYKHVFIDLDNTLWAFLANAKEAFREVYATLKLNRYFDSFEQFYELYEPNNQRLWGMYGKGRITKDELNHDRFLHPFLSVGVNDEDFSRTFGELALSVIPTKSALMPHARELLEYLHPKYKLYILSNGFKALQYTKMRSSQIEHFFEKVILSEDINITKPQPGIFQYALQQAGATAVEAIMIGDNFEADIWGASQVGIDQIFYNVEAQKKLPLVDDEVFIPTYTVDSLQEIMALL